MKTAEQLFKDLSMASKAVADADRRIAHHKECLQSLQFSKDQVVDQIRLAFMQELSELLGKYQAKISADRDDSIWRSVVIIEDCHGHNLVRQAGQNQCADYDASSLQLLINVHGH